VYKEIIPTENSFYIVRDEQELKDKKKDMIGIIDENETFIVPYNIYSHISPYNNGLARIRMLPKNGKGDFDGFIDLNGKLVFKITDSKIWEVEDFDGKFAKVSLSVNNGNSSDDLYEGFINRTGELVIDNKKFDQVYPFVENRALVQNQDDGYYFISESGKIINKTPYDEVAEAGFTDRKAIVSIENEWQIIDTNLNPLLKKEIKSSRVKYSNNTLFFYDDEKEKWGFWDLTRNITPEIYFDYFDQSGFKDNLLLIQDGPKLCYINKSGEKIWTQEIDTNKLMALNIDYMSRGYYYAYSTPIEKELNYGGWGRSSNLPANKSNYSWAKENKLNFYLSIEDTTLNSNIKAKKLYIFNATADTIFFPAQDSRLYLKIQALNKKGTWQDIEYLPSSWCGNSYHTLQLAPGEYWKFATPIYTGEFKTKLRAELKYQIGSESDKGTKYVYIYTNEFEGSVNPAQFWRKLEYHPQGIMDPYNN
jgi:hypothetical protein